MIASDTLRIDLSPLEEGVHTFVLTPSVAALDLDPNRFADVRVHVLVNFYNGRALMHLEATAEATLECDRTLKLFQQEISGSYEVLFVPAAASEHEAEASDAHDEIQEISPSHPEIDLTELVRDTLLLAIPARCISPEAEQMEIQTVFGALTSEDGDVIDPRWEALRKLKNDNADAS